MNAAIRSSSFKKAFIAIRNVTSERSFISPKVRVFSTKRALSTAVRVPKGPSPLLMANGTLLGGSAAWYQLGLDDRTKQRVQARAEAMVRLGRLIKTVAQMVALYKFGQWKDLYLNSKDQAENDPLEEAKEALWEAQDIQDKVGRRWLSSMTAEEKEIQSRRAEECHKKVLEAAQKLAEVEEALQQKGLEAASSKSKLHLEGANLLLKLCRDNAGVYIKLGQHLAQLDYLLPREYVEKMQSLLDCAPQTPYSEVRTVIKEELGKYPEEVWSKFDPEPIASASLAQVHIAHDQDGRKLAVKVQHKGLRETSQGDIDAVSFFVHLVANIFPEFQYTWLADEIAPNLPKELDFEHEGRNAERCQKMFANNDLIQIPKVIWKDTSSRILCMEFEEGCNATDVEEMKKQGIPLYKVAELISTAFNEQIFKHGFVHCDPHPANVLIRPYKGNPKTPQMVLLDHGLYKQIDDKFRLDYCRLWKALVFADIKNIKHYCMKMGAGDMYTLLAAMLTNRPWDEIADPDPNSMHAKVTDADKTMIQGYAQRYAMEISTMLDSVPRQMLLLFKANDCLRHIDRQLGAPINTFVITGKICTDVLFDEEMKDRSSTYFILHQRVSHWFTSYLTQKLLSYFDWKRSKNE